MGTEPAARRQRWLALVIVGLVVAVVLVSGFVVVRLLRDGAPTSATTTTIQGVDPDRVDPREDATVIECGTGDDGATVVRVANTSDTAAVYMVAVKAVDRDGAPAGTAGAPVPLLEPGAEVDVTIDEMPALPDGAQCEVLQVIKTPSTVGG